MNGLALALAGSLVMAPTYRVVSSNLTPMMDVDTNSDILEQV